jgi:hypothetical protein
VPATIVTTTVTTTTISVATIATTTAFSPPPLFFPPYQPPSPSSYPEREQDITHIQTLADLLAQTITATPSTLPQQPIEQPIEQLVEQPIEQLVEQPIEQLVEQPIEQPVEQPVEQPNQQLSRQLPTLDEFLADLRHREPLDSIQACRDPIRLANYLVQTGQEDDAPEIVHAREMALATTGLFADCTATMAYYLATDNQSAFMREKAQQQASKRSSLKAIGASSLRVPKRAAAEKASAAWAGLSPQKRQRNQ